MEQQRNEARALASWFFQEVVAPYGFKKEMVKQLRKRYPWLKISVQQPVLDRFFARGGGAMNKLCRWALHKLQRQCRHPNVKADLLEGDTYRRVMWCETCGAVNVKNLSDELRLPEPLWEER